GSATYASRSIRSWMRRTSSRTDPPPPQPAAAGAYRAGSRSNAALQRGQQKWNVRPSCTALWRDVATSTIMPQTGSTASPGPAPPRAGAGAPPIAGPAARAGARGRLPGRAALPGPGPVPGSERPGKDSGVEPPGTGAGAGTFAGT